MAFPNRQAFSSFKRRSLLTILNYLPATTTQFKYVQHFFFYLSYVQFISILLSIQITILAPNPIDTFPYYVGHVVEIFSFRTFFADHFEASSYAFFLICVWIYFFIFLLVLGLLVIRAITRIQLIKLPRYFLDNFFQSHFKIFFWIINMILLTPWSTHVHNKSTSLGLYDDSSVFYLLNTICLILNYSIGILLSCFCTMPFRGQNLYASYTSFSQLFTFLSKAVLAPMLIFLHKENQHVGISLAIVGLIASILELSVQVKYMPYYVPKITKRTFLWNFIAVWISICNVIITTYIKKIPHGNNNGILFVEVLFLPLVIKLAFVVFRRMMKYYMAIPIENLSTENQVYKKLLSFTLMFEASKLAILDNAEMNPYEAYFLGDLTSHSMTCTEPDCVCSTLTKSSPPKEILLLREGFELYKLKRISEILSTTIENIKNNHKLKLTQAIILLQNQNIRPNGALTFLYSIPKQTANLSVRVKKHILLRIVQVSLDKYFRGYQDNVLNVKIYVDFHGAVVKFKDLLLSNTRKYLDFWDTYKQSNFKLMTLYNKNEAFEKEADTIDNLWKENNEKFPHFFNVIGDGYCNYKRLVQNSPFYASKIASKYAWKAKINSSSKNINFTTQEDLFQPDNIAFYVSMAKERLGRIQYVSSNVKDIIGYTQEDLTGKNINVLISPLLGREHDMLLHKSISLNNANLYDEKNFRQNSGYVRTKKGFFTPSTQYITIFPYVEKELTYLGLVKVYKPEYEQIIMTENGYIDGFTEGVGKNLMLPLDKNVFIAEVCPELSLFVQKKSTKLASLIMEALNDNTNEKEFISSKQKTFSIFKRRASKKDASEIEVENVWKVVKFIKKSDNHSLEYIKYEAKLVPTTLLNKKFFIILLKLYIEESEECDAAPKPTRKETTLIDNSFEVEIPYEKDFFTQDFIPSSFRNNTMKGQIETETALLDSTTRIKLQSPLYQANLISPRIEGSSEGGVFLSARTNASYGENNQVTEITKRVSLFKDPQFGLTKKEESVKSRNLSNKTSSPVQSKFQRIKENKLNKISEKDSSITSSGASSKLEQAVHSLPKSLLIRNIILLVCSFSLLCICFLGGVLVKGEDTLTLMKGNVDILDYSSLRLIQLLLLQRDIQISYLLRNNYIFNNRTSSPFSILLPILISADARTLNTMNNNLRASLNITEPALQQQILDDKILVVQEGSQIYAKNTFQVTTEMVAKAMRYSKQPFIYGTSDPYMEFIMTNGNNKLLTTSEAIGAVTIEDNHIKFSSFENLSLIFLLLVILSGLALLLLLGSQQIKLIKARDKFIDIFLRCNNHELSFNLNRVSLFESSLMKTTFKHFSLRTDGESIRKENIENVKPDYTRIQRKKVDPKNLNRNQVIVFMLAVILYMIFITPFISTAVLVRTNGVVVKAKVGKIVEVNNSLYEMILLLVSFYDYIIKGENALLRTRPINKEWEDIFQGRSNAQNFFFNFIIANEKEKTCNKQSLEIFKELIDGNLCEILPSQASQASCEILANGALRKGIQGINSFTLYTLRNIKNEYDKSQRTKADAIIALDYQDLKDIETFIGQWQYNAYIKLQNTLQQCIIEGVDNIKSELETMIGIFIALYLILIPTLLYQIKKKIEREKIGWRKIIRRIPIDVIMNNKILKTYLEKENNVGFKL